MSLKIAGRLFTGPFAVADAKIRKNHPACVYCIVSKEGKPWNPTFRLIDVGENCGTDIVFADAPRRPVWERLAQGALAVYVLELSEAEWVAPAARRALVEAIRTTYDPPHGEIPISGM